jgi:glycosyltransferase involved in cell wall biosynthesis
MKISIITPSYNQGNFIGQTFDSILSQKLPKGTLQYILVDALSTDSTDKVVQKYKPLFKKAGIDFIYISEKDRGQSDAINKGLRLATGELQTYLNSDDYYEPNVLPKVLEFFTKNPRCFWAFGGWNIVDRTGKYFRTYQPESFNTFAFRSYASNIGQPSCFWRKGLIKRVGLINESLHLAMDYDLWLRFLQKVEPMIMPFAVANLRYYSGAKSGSFMVKHNWQAFCVAARHAHGNVLILAHAAIRFALGYLSIRLWRNISQVIEKK